jgi:hypothetical protein
MRIASSPSDVSEDENCSIDMLTPPCAGKILPGALSIRAGCALKEVVPGTVVCLAFPTTHSGQSDRK